jgi:hypothetical protein
MWEKRNAYKILAGIPQLRRPFREARLRREIVVQRHGAEFGLF